MNLERSNPMTPRQIYGDLAKIAGHRCTNGKMFVDTDRVGREHLRIVQNRLLALMEKIEYYRTHRDFRGISPRARTQVVSTPTNFERSTVPPIPEYLSVRGVLDDTCPI